MWKEGRGRAWDTQGNKEHSGRRSHGGEEMGRIWNELVGERLKSVCNQGVPLGKRGNTSVPTAPLDTFEATPIGRLLPPGKPRTPPRPPRHGIRRSHQY